MKQAIELIQESCYDHVRSLIWWRSSNKNLGKVWHLTQTEWICFPLFHQSEFFLPTSMARWILS